MFHDIFILKGVVKCLDVPHCSRQIGMFIKFKATVYVLYHKGSNNRDLPVPL